MRVRLRIKRNYRCRDIKYLRGIRPHKVEPSNLKGYVLTYALPEKAGGQHAVKVLLTSDPRLEFRARHAYSDAE